MKRQRGRNRGGGGGGKPQQNANRAFESNGPDNLKIRGHAQHVFEKYQQLARDATSSGDRVLAENFLQHAEHYFRLLRTLQPNRPYTDIVSREGFVSGYDIDFEDEGGDNEDGEGGADGSEGEERDYRDASRDNRWENRNGDNRSGENRDNRNGDTRNGDSRSGERGGGEARDHGRGEQPYRSDQNRGYANGRPNNNNNNNNAPRNRDERNFNRDRPDGSRWETRGGETRGAGENRGDAARWESGRQERAEPADGDGRGEDRRPDRSERAERERFDRPQRAYGERSETPREPAPQAARDPEPQTAPLFVEAAPPQPSSAPDAREQGRGGRGRVLRSRDGDVSHTPAFLNAAAAASPETADAAETPVKRPRGRPRKKADEAPPTSEEG